MPNQKSRLPLYEDSENEFFSRHSKVASPNLRKQVTVQNLAFASRSTGSAPERFVGSSLGQRSTDFTPSSSPGSSFLSPATASFSQSFSPISDGSTALTSPQSSDVFFESEKPFQHLPVHSKQDARNFFSPLQSFSSQPFTPLPAPDVASSLPHAATTRPATYLYNEDITNLGSLGRMESPQTRLKNYSLATHIDAITHDEGLEVPIEFNQNDEPDDLPPIPRKGQASETKYRNRMGQCFQELKEITSRCGQLSLEGSGKRDILVSAAELIKKQNEKLGQIREELEKANQEIDHFQHELKLRDLMNAFRIPQDIEMEAFSGVAN